MKKKIFVPVAAFFLVAAPACASLMDEAFVVETTDSDATDSLNRIAGTLDKGFLSEEYTYKSAHHKNSVRPPTQEDAYDVS